jgi:antitoxin (DNA-binding transcriptional repressor) of toxin-antitoxin stability system
MLEQPTHVALIIDSMTPPEKERAEKVVGVRELRDHLSRYLDEVAEGIDIVVTVRGRRVARLARDEHDPFAELRARGLIREPTAPWFPLPEPIPVKGSGSVSELIERR